MSNLIQALRPRLKSLSESMYLLALAIQQLLACPPGRIESGEILLGGEELLRVEHLKKYFDINDDIKHQKHLCLKAVDDVSFTLNRGEVLGIVGESGCGKSTLVNTILNLFDPTDGEEIFRHPRHPYTRALFDAIPSLSTRGMEGLKTLEGQIPSPITPPPGCAFHERCAYACDRCKQEAPQQRDLGGGHMVSCLRTYELTALK